MKSIETNRGFQTGADPSRYIAMSGSRRFEIRGFYDYLYQSARRIGRPFIRRMSLKRIGAFELGKGRPRRIGRALVSYVSDYVRFVTERASLAVWDRDDIGEVLDRLGQGKFAGHYHHRESADLVRQLIERGFIVDCIYDRAGYLIEDVSGYDFILDEWNNMERWAAQNPNARTCFYSTGCHWLFWNRAELQRLDWLLRRKGVLLAPERQLPAMTGLAKADAVTYYGNDFARQHYAPVRPKLRKVWVCPSADSSKFETKDWNNARRRFLYYGGASWVHRGLDLVLEAFLDTVSSRYSSVARITAFSTSMGMISKAEKTFIMSGSLFLGPLSF